MIKETLRMMEKSMRIVKNNKDNKLLLVCDMIVFIILCYMSIGDTHGE